MKLGRPPLDDTERQIAGAIAWLEARRRDAQDQRYGLWRALMVHSSVSPESDRYRLSECLARLQQFDTLIAQHKVRLHEHQKVKREQQRLATRERERLAYAWQESDCEPLIYAVARADALTVKVVDAVPPFVDHRLATQLSQQSATLEAWNYRCLGTRNRRPSRRYEGFQVSR